MVDGSKGASGMGVAAREGKHARGRRFGGGGGGDGGRHTSATPPRQDVVELGGVIGHSRREGAPGL